MNNYFKNIDLTLWEIRINKKYVKTIRGRKSAEKYAHKCTGNLFERKEVSIVCKDTGEYIKIS